MQGAKRKKLHIIAITDHGTRDGGLEATRIAKGIRVLIGQETKTREGDILVFNVDENLPERQPLDKTCKLAKKHDGFIIVPHPFDPLRQGVGKHLKNILKYVDAIEGFNPKCFFELSNKRAEAFARDHQLPAIASSDAHKPGDVGMAHTLIEGRDPFEAIRQGKVEMVRNRVGKPTLLKRRVRKVLEK